MLQFMEVAVRLPPFKPPKVAPVEYEAPQLLPLPDLLDEEVRSNTGSDSLLQQRLSNHLCFLSSSECFTVLLTDWRISCLQWMLAMHN